MDSIITRIIKDSSLTVDEKVEKVVTSLNALPDKGVDASVQLILHANDLASATYPANYLALLPNVRSKKRQAIEHILDHKENILVAATNLIKGMPDDIIDHIIAMYLTDRSMPGIRDLIFEVAQYFPEKLHKHKAEINEEYIQEAVLSGGPDQWVNDIVDRYRKSSDHFYLTQLACFRTNKAIDALLTLLPDVPEEEQEDVASYIESSGVFPDTRLASIYFKQYRGYVVTREESPHFMGGDFPYPVPKCPFTDIPANRILTLDPAHLDLNLDSPYNPTFFWYEGQHPPDYVYVQFTENGIKGLMTPMTEGQTGTDLIPGELALKLEKVPYKPGRSGPIYPGFSNHQVGGYPSLIRFECFPRCPLCSKGMNFLVSIDSGMTPFGKLLFNGILYGFWCDTCFVSCTHRQTGED
jgi:hypothetical protein